MDCQKENEESIYENWSITKIEVVSFLHLGPVRALGHIVVLLFDMYSHYGNYYGDSSRIWQQVWLKIQLASSQAFTPQNLDYTIETLVKPYSWMLYS